MPKKKTAEEIAADKKRFDEVISPMARSRNEFTDEFIKEAKKRAVLSKYEQSKYDQKRMMGDMVRYYTIPAADDSDLLNILAEIKALSKRNDSAYFGSVKTESKNYNYIIEALKKYQEKLDKEDERIHKESVKFLTDADGNWYDDGYIEDTPKLRTKSRELTNKQRKNDDKRRIAADLFNFLEAERDGKLVVTEQDKKEHRFIDTAGKSFHTKFDTEMNDLLTTGTGLSYAKNNKDKALFPHEPSANDIKQGMIGDCYFVQALSDIARLNPEALKSAMTDNNDGTVTVRLFSKQADGTFDPVYVRVDKVVPMIGIAFEEGAIGSPWVNCMERALAAAGLNASVKDNGDSWQPVPKDIETRYITLLRKKNRGEAFTEDEIRANPWIFNGQKELIPWPNYQSIVGGQGGNAAEMILGPGYSTYELNIYAQYNHKQQNINIKLNNPSMLNIAEIALFGSDLISKKAKPKQDYEFAASEDDLVRKFIQKMVPGDMPANIVEQYKAVVRIVIRETSKVMDSGISLIDAYAKLTEINPKQHPSDVPATLIPLYEAVMESAQQSGGIIYKEMIRNEVYDLAREVGEKGLIGCVGSRHDSPDNHEMKIMDGHEYSLIGAYTDEITGKRYIRLRNPWAEENKLSIQLFGGSALVEHTDSQGNVTTEWESDRDGIFDIELEQFLHDVDRIQVNGMDHGLQGIEMSGKSKDVDFTYSAILKNKTAFSQTMLRKFLLSETEDNNVTLPGGEITDEIVEDILEKVANADFDEADDDSEADYKKIYIDNCKKGAKLMFRNFSEAMNDAFEKHPEGLDEKSLEELRDDLKSRIKTLNSKQTQETHKAAIFMEAIFNQVKAAPDTLEMCQKSEAKFHEVETMLALPENERPKLFIAPKAGSVLTSKEQLPQITGTRITEEGKQIYTIRVNGGRTYEKDAFDVYNNCHRIIVKPLEKAAEAEAHPQPVNIVGTADYAVVRNYIRAVNDAYISLCETDDFFSRSSEQFNALKESLCETRKSLSHCSGKSMDAVIDLMDDIRVKIGNYTAHCLETPNSGNRRKARVMICDVLKKVCDSATLKKDDPCFEMQQDLAKKMLKAHPSFKGKNISEEQFNNMAKHFADDRSFRSSFGGLNICASTFYDDKMIKKCLETFQEQNKDFSRLKTKDVIEKVVAVDPVPRI